MEESQSFVGDKRSLKRILVIKHRVANMCTIRGTGARGRYTNVQIQKCTNTRYTNIQIHKYKMHKSNTSF